MGSSPLRSPARSSSPRLTAAVSVTLPAGLIRFGPLTARTSRTASALAERREPWPLQTRMARRSPRSRWQTRATSTPVPCPGRRTKSTSRSLRVIRGATRSGSSTSRRVRSTTSTWGDCRSAKSPGLRMAHGSHWSPRANAADQVACLSLGKMAHTSATSTTPCITAALPHGRQMDDG